MRGFLGALFAVVFLAGCSAHAPPVGRWEGTYDTAEAMVAVRVEIDSKGLVRSSAPNAEDVGDSEDTRAAMRQTLAQGLAGGWDDVEPHAMDFDGRVFRKPHGIAPQMIWEKATKQMYVVVYLGKKPAIKFLLRPVEEFSDDPWSG
jgi:hypothetical protein